MQILIILFTLFGNTELFNKTGKKISEDKHGKDGTVTRKPLKGIAIHKKGRGDKPVLVLQKSAVERIIK